jgi:hypothetical protein
MAAVVEHIQTGTDSIEIGDFKMGRVKINFTAEESQSEDKANAHIDRMARLRQRAVLKLGGKPVIPTQSEA